MNTQSLSKQLGTFALLLSALLASAANAEGDVERGQKLGNTCLGCHGIEGYRNAYPSYRVPKLGGQQAGYLQIALKGYRSGMRAHPTMVAQAASLTDQDIADVSAYLASLSGQGVADSGSDAPTLEAAQTCVACHGQNGISIAPSWPSLAGQHEDYLKHALTQYREGERKDPVMMPLAASLDDASIELLAKYYADLEGLETTDAD